MFFLLESFAQDFFLTYPAFMQISEICDGLLDAYNDLSPPATSHFSIAARNSRLSSVEDMPLPATDEQVLAKKRRSARISTRHKMWFRIVRLVKNTVKHVLVVTTNYPQ